MIAVFLLGQYFCSSASQEPFKILTLGLSQRVHLELNMGQGGTRYFESISLGRLAVPLCFPVGVVLPPCSDAKLHQNQSCRDRPGVSR